jgi:hypothetical protein
VTAGASCGLLVDDAQQVHGLPVAAGMTGAPHRRAVHRQRPPLPEAMTLSLVRAPQPGTHRGVKGGCVHGFQDPADGRFIRCLEPPRQRIMADAEGGQDLRRRIRHPLADGRE